jgi:NADH-quinone oxidoreductase subunit A
MAGAEAAGPLWPILVYFGAVLVVIAGMLGLSFFLGQRHWERATGAPFECGLITTGSARLRLPVNFYLMALFFVVFDLEAVCLFAWAVAVRQAGWTGFVGAGIFIAMLLAALGYLWRRGALEGR